MVEILLIVGAALITSNWLTEKFNLIGPLVLIAVGVLIRAIPGVPYIGVEPEIVLQVFLPVLLYWEALNISLRGIKQALRGVILNGTLMVLWVAVAVGLMAPAVGLPLGMAFVIGAAVGPTDATAVSSLGKGINRRQMVVLRAESLINDGTALVIFTLAVKHAGGNAHITTGRVILSFLISFIGGALVGLLVGWVIARIGRFVENPMLANIFRLFTPFLAFFLAEEIEASGVLAVVVCGLYMAQIGPRFVSAASRSISKPFIGMITYILNSLLFLLVGLHLAPTIQGLNSDTIAHAAFATVVLYVVMMLARWIFGETIIRLIRLLDRRPSQKLRRTTFFERLVTTVAGFRGAISLAVAFSVPEMVDGEPFPYRDEIIFITSGIVILSLIVQGFFLPKVVALSNSHPNPNRHVDPLEDQKEIRGAMIDSMNDIFGRLDEIGQSSGVSIETVDRTRDEMSQQKRSWMEAKENGFEDKVLEERQESQDFRLAIIRASRENYIRYRDEGKIDDEALIYLLELTDLDEIRITGPIEME